MLLSDVKEIVKEVINNGCNVNLCLQGHQGIGKTQILQQVAQEMGYHYVSLYCAQTSTEDLLGMPVPVIDKDGERRTEYAVPKLFPKEPNTIFVLEEINRSPIEVQQAVLQLLTDKKIGNFRLPENTLICACINPNDGIYMTQSLDSVFINRLVMINVEASIKEWVDYARSINVNQDILDFVESLNANEKSIHFSQIPSSKTLDKPIPSPRTWMIANELLKLDVPNTSLQKLLAGCIGEATATKFMQTRGQLSKIVSIKEILNDFKNIETKLKSQSHGTLHKTVSDAIALLNITDSDAKSQYTSDQLYNLGCFVDYLCDNNKAFASVILNKLDINNIKSILFCETSKVYKDKTHIDLAMKLIEVARSSDKKTK